MACLLLPTLPQLPARLVTSVSAVLRVPLLVGLYLSPVLMPVAFTHHSRNIILKFKSDMSE